MARKRKRVNQCFDFEMPAAKRGRVGIDDAKPQNDACRRTLQHFYSHIQTLRQYILSKLPRKAKSRRRRIEQTCLRSAHDESRQSQVRSQADSDAGAGMLSQTRADSTLARLLDNTFVCANGVPSPRQGVHLVRDFEAFSQRNGSAAQSSFGEATVSLSDIVDFSIWTLFHRTYRHIGKPQHLLCQGFQRAHAFNSSNQGHCALGNIPGLILHYPNNNVNQLKAAAWEDLYGLMGRAGERLMLDLLIDYSVFVPLPPDDLNLHQICGTYATRQGRLPTHASRNAVVRFAAIRASQAMSWSYAQRPREA